MKSELYLDFSLPNIRLPSDYSEFVSALSAQKLSNLVVQDPPLQSVTEYSISEHGNSFPRPSQHFVIADYLIDLPIIAVDLEITSSTYLQVLGYCTGDWWIVGSSLADFAKRVEQSESAFYGIE